MKFSPMLEKNQFLMKLGANVSLARRNTELCFALTFLTYYKHREDW